MGVHGALLAVLILAPGYSSNPPPLEELQLMPTLVTVTDDGQVRGGVEHPRPVSNAEKPGDPAKGDPKPPKVAESKPVEPTPAVPPKPEVRSDPPSETRIPPPRKTVDIATEVKHDMRAKEKTPVKSARANDDSESDEKPKTETTKIKATKPESDDGIDPVVAKRQEKKKVEISKEVKRRSSDDDKVAREAREAERQAEQEAADRIARAEAWRQAINSANRQRSELASRLGSAATDISKTAGTTMEIEMPGSGGQVFADYRSFLARFYKEKWNLNKPGGISAKSAATVVEITVSNPGKLIDYKVTQRSGIPEVDASVERVLKTYQKLMPFPSQSKDDKRTFILRFMVESDTSA